MVIEMQVAATNCATRDLYYRIPPILNRRFRNRLDADVLFSVPTQCFHSESERRWIRVWMGFCVMWARAQVLPGVGWIHLSETILRWSPAARDALVFGDRTKEI